MNWQPEIASQLPYSDLVVVLLFPDGHSCAPSASAKPQALMNDLTGARRGLVLALLEKHDVCRLEVLIRRWPL